MKSQIKIDILTAYYERGKVFYDVIKALSGALKRKTDFNVTHYILDDGSIDYPADGLKLHSFELKNYKIKLFAHETKHGKTLYYETVNDLMWEAKKGDGEYIMFMPDDRVPCKELFPKMMELYERLSNMFPNTRPALNLDIDSAKEKAGIIPNQQLDGAFITLRKSFDLLGWEIPSVQSTGSSSGVWRMFSERFLYHDKLCDVWHPDCSFLYHSCWGDSVMNPHTRRMAPMKTIGFLDGIPDHVPGVQLPW